MQPSMAFYNSMLQPYVRCVCIKNKIIFPFLQSPISGKKLLDLFLNTSYLTPHPWECQGDTFFTWSIFLTYQSPVYEYPEKLLVDAPNTYTCNVVTLLQVLEGQLEEKMPRSSFTPRNIQRFGGSICLSIIHQYISPTQILYTVVQAICQVIYPSCVLSGGTFNPSRRTAIFLAIVIFFSV